MTAEVIRKSNLVIRTFRYLITNHLGSSCIELDDLGNIISFEEYHPFGTTSYRSGRSETEVSLKRYKYVMKELDNETGLYYYGMRYYAPWLARFVSLDPLQVKYPQYTPYQYAGNKPVTFMDLDGLEEDLVTAKKAKETNNISASPTLSSDFEQKYPKSADYIKNYMLKDILKSPSLLNALSEYSGGASEEIIVKAFTDFYSIIETHHAGNGGAYYERQIQNYDKVGNYYSTFEHNMSIHEDIFQLYEDSNKYTETLALLVLYTEILHEFVHLLDYYEPDNFNKIFYNDILICSSSYFSNNQTPGDVGVDFIAFLFTGPTRVETIKDEAEKQIGETPEIQIINNEKLSGISSDHIPVFTGNDLDADSTLLNAFKVLSFMKDSTLVPTVPK